MNNDFVWYIINVHHGYSVFGNAGRPLDEVGSGKCHRADQSMMVPSWEAFTRASVVNTDEGV
jgi:hypothetical protein